MNKRPSPIGHNKNDLGRHTNDFSDYLVMGVQNNYNLLSIYCTN